MRGKSISLVLVFCLLWSKEATLNFHRNLAYTGIMRSLSSSQASSGPIYLLHHDVRLFNFILLFQASDSFGILYTTSITRQLGQDSLTTEQAQLPSSANGVTLD